MGGYFATYYSLDGVLIESGGKYVDSYLCSEGACDADAQTGSTLDLSETNSNTFFGGRPAGGAWSAQFTWLYEGGFDITQLVARVSIGSVAERVRLWSHNQLVIDQWDSLSGVSTVGGLQALPTINLKFVPGEAQEFKVQYYSAGGANSALKFEFTQDGSSWSVVPSSAMFLPSHVWGSPFEVDVKVSHACASTSAISQPSGYESVTAGVTAKFTITSRDRFSNTRVGMVDNFHLRVVIIQFFGLKTSDYAFVSFVDHSRFSKTDSSDVFVL